MKILNTKFKDLFILKKNRKKDKRGFFLRDYCEKELQKINFKIKQINISFNKKSYTLRGFHYQIKPYQEDKLITCIEGKIFNVSIDLRKNSKTYLQSFKYMLDHEKSDTLCVPKGFANAYMTLKPNTKILYYMSEFYKPKKSMSIRYNDPYFSIKWPTYPRVISMKDKKIIDFNEKKHK